MPEDDGVIRVGTSVDLSGLKAGMQQAAETARTGANSMADALKQAQLATQNLAEAQKQLGASAAAGNAQAQEIIDSYRQQSEAANATAQSFTNVRVASGGLDAAYEALAQTTADAALAQADLKTAIKGVVDGTTPYAAAAESLTLALRDNHEASLALAAAKRQVASEMLKSSDATKADADAAVVDTEAAQKLRAAYTELASAVLRQNAIAAEYKSVIAQLAQGNLDEEAAVNLLTNALQRQAEAADVVKAAKANLAEATNLETAAENENTDALVENNAARRQAYDSVYALSGSTFGASRAIADFTSRFPILQGAIAAAFDVAIVVAFASIAVKAGEAIYEGFKKSWAETLKFQQSVTSVSSSFDVLIARTQVETDKLEAANAKLQHKPAPNAIKQALDEAILAAAEMNSKLDMILSKEQTMLQSSILNPSWEVQAITGVGGTKSEQNMLEQHRLNLSLAKNISDQMKESVSYGNALQSKLADIQKQIASDKTTIRQSTVTGDDMYAVGAARDIAAKERQVKALQLLINYQRQEQAAIQDTMSLQAAQHKNVKLQAHHTADEELKHAATVQKQAQEKIITTWKQQFAAEQYLHTDNLAAEKSFWQQKVLAAKDGTLSYTYALDQLMKVEEKIGKLPGRPPTTGVINAPSSLVPVQSPTAVLSTLMGHMAKNSDAYLKAVGEATAAQQKSVYLAQEATVQFEQQTGSISKYQAAVQTAKIHIAELNAQLQRLNQQMLLEQQIGNKAGAEQLFAQKIQVQGQLGAATQSLHAAMVQPLLSAFSQINEGWIKVQDHMFYSTRRLGLAFAEMGQSLVLSGVNAAEKWALGWLEKEALTVAFHHLANAQKEASDIAYDASSIAQTSLKNTLAAHSYAAVAGAAAAASAAAIPVIGWSLAPAASAAVFAQTEAYAAMASFDVGTGYVPRDGVAMLHKGEAVIPAPSVAQLREGGGSTFSYSQENHFHGGYSPDKEFQRLLDRNAASVAGALKRHLRQGGSI